MSVSSLIDTIDTQLALLIADPNKIVDFQEGNVKITASQKIKELRELRKSLLESPPDTEIDIAEFDVGVDMFGNNEA
jgi:hypothetical protein